MDHRVSMKCAMLLLRKMAITFQQVLINGICVVCRVGSYPIEGKGEAERLQGVKARGCGRKRGRPRGPAELAQLGEVPLL